MDGGCSQSNNWNFRKICRLYFGNGLIKRAECRIMGEVRAVTHQPHAMPTQARLVMGQGQARGRLGEPVREPGLRQADRRLAGPQGIVQVDSQQLGRGR